MPRLISGLINRMGFTSWHSGSQYESLTPDASAAPYQECHSTRMKRTQLLGQPILDDNMAHGARRRLVMLRESCTNVLGHSGICCGTKDSMRQGPRLSHLHPLKPGSNVIVESLSFEDRDNSKDDHNVCNSSLLQCHNSVQTSTTSFASMEKWH